MNLKSITIIFIFCLGCFKMSRAQVANEKELKKEWKKKMKEMEPLQFKALVDERDKLKNDLVLSQAKVAEVENDLRMKAVDNDSLKAQVARQQQQLEDLKTVASAQMAAASVKKPASPDAPAIVEKKPISQMGVIFKVQVGTFRNKDLSKYFENNANFSGEIDEDGAKKYTLGLFKDYWEADNFKKYMREMGVNDAWIVSYKDGKRVPIKEVLEGASQTP